MADKAVCENPPQDFIIIKALDTQEGGGECTYRYVQLHLRR